MYCCPLSFFPPCWTFSCICFICLFAWLCLLEATGKRTSSVYRAHGISIILGIFQHSLILIGLAAIVSRSQAHQQLVMPSGGNMSITKRVALFRRRGEIYVNSLRKSRVVTIEFQGLQLHRVAFKAHEL